MQSTTPNKALMEQARVALRGKLGKAAGAYALICLIMAVIQIVPVVGVIVQLVLTGPVMFGLALYALRISRSEDVALGVVFSGFNDFGRTLIAYLLTTIYVLLWSLLLIIPGIMAGFSYAMTYFLLADNPNMGASEAITESKRLMMGNRWKLFCLGLNFIGWILLTIATFFCAAAGV